MTEICVLGLGYIGLPTASMLATHGFQVHGVDVNPKAVDVINQGGAHIEEPGLKTLVQAAVHSGCLRAYTQPRPADVYMIAVPTPITPDKRADLSYIQAAARSIVPLLKPNDLVILESTSPPGTTLNFLAPILAESGLSVGTDLHVAHCPERVLPGKIIKELIQNTRVIGGLSHESAERAKAIYQRFVEGEIHLTDATTAEMVKVMENTYRDVNIALANELAQIAPQLEINAWDVIRYANLHPRVQIHSPGPGVGGHCISVDPWFVVEQFPHTAHLIQQARRINDAMPEYVYRMVQRAIQGVPRPKVALLGVTYKANVDDTRESPALALIEQLARHPDILLAIYDPHVTRFAHELSAFEETFHQADCVVLAIDHDEFKYLDPRQLIRLVRTPIIIDTRRALDATVWRSVGFDYRLLGQDPVVSERDIRPSVPVALSSGRLLPV